MPHAVLRLSQDSIYVAKERLCRVSQEHIQAEEYLGQQIGRKKIVHTLQSCFDDAVKPYLRDGVLQDSNYKNTIKSIHSSVVAGSKRSLVNRVLGLPHQMLTQLSAHFHLEPGIRSFSLDRMKASVSKTISIRLELLWMIYVRFVELLRILRSTSSAALPLPRIWGSLTFGNVCMRHPASFKPSHPSITSLLTLSPPPPLLEPLPRRTVTPLTRVART
jgi:hypothetical protein